MKPLLFALALLGCAAPTPVRAQYPDVAPGRYEKTLDVSGAQRTYILRVPKGYDKDKATPLVLMLHGWTGTAKGVEVGSGIAEIAEREGWISVFPQGLGNPPGWNSAFLNLAGPKVDDVTFFSKLLDSLETQLHVDRDRIFVAGHSNGAMMAHVLGSKLSDRIAAIGAVAGVIGLKPAAQIAAPSNPISVLMIHGKRDTMVTYDASVEGLLKGIPAPVGAAWWAEKVGIEGKPVEETTDGGKIVTQTWKGGRNGTEVELVTLRDAPHDWMTRNHTGFDAAETIMAFFRSHPKLR